MGNLTRPGGRAIMVAEAYVRGGAKHTATRVASRRSSGQAGSSLIEVLVAMVLVAGVVMGIMSGFFTTTTISGATDATSSTQAALASVAERTTTMPYRRCATVAQLNSDLAGWPGAYRPVGFTVEVTAVAYLDRTTPAYVATCTTDRGAQLLTIAVTSSSDAGARASGQVVVRDPLALPS